MKMHWQILKILSYWTTMPISHKPVQTKGNTLFQGKVLISDIKPTVLYYHSIAQACLLLRNVSQVSDVVHEPLFARWFEEISSNKFELVYVWRPSLYMYMFENSSFICDIPVMKCINFSWISIKYIDSCNTIFIVRNMMFLNIRKFYSS